ncbi:Flp pilus assembly protein CpaB [Streptomyces sp. SID4919]|uniref:Pilus assembly protein CpaB n=1 Tax=Streptomyces uncialis TaxID=1048205 RepID=A0A1Q4VEM1_9ACTN|nr:MULTISPECIES: Flp pilus assembly protein CpaB [Streptomyces]MYY11163.1 Flp pilus assembly protein CpaB [Streptomyces sp. SID4919]OKH96267.1 pilus assembly protein CpaB [Streptomyces uncialis]WST68415.1 Flp pilus assembly protein CpaB [Streptomyces uncialis]WTE12956.1 Flp pilus assembly protein CpaB [Streptomyces uncialis]SCK16126.1 pilus assembly protein CpaB [Streptomyces sp. AmelKG-E11A]
MNSRQRRGVILLVLSVLCAVGAFAGVLSVIRDVNSKVGPEVTAYRLKQDIDPYKALSTGQFEKISMPERWLSGNAVTDLAAIRGKIAVTRLERGSLLQSDMIVERPELNPGQQEIAIMIDAATGVAGKIHPGASVNIYATFEGEDGKTKSESRVIVAGAEVIDVGKLTALEPDRRDRSRRSDEAVPITFALGTADAQRVAYAESFATHVRLALVAPGGAADVPPGDRKYTLDEDR